MSSFEATIEPPAQRAKVMSKKYADSSGLCSALCSCRGFSIARAVIVGGHGVIDLQFNHPVLPDHRLWRWALASPGSSGDRSRSF
jgi:hypothetical protein